MGALRIAASTAFVLLAAATPAAAAPGFLGRGHDPGVAVDGAGTAHVAWLASAPNGAGTLEYCQVPRGKRACATRSSVPLESDGFGKVQVLLPRPGVVQIVAPLLDPTPLLTSIDNGVTFVRRNLGDLPAIETAFYSPGGGISIMSGSGPASYGRFAPDGTGPGELPVQFADATESLTTTLSPFGNGLITMFSGLATRSAIWNGLGDPNLQQSWVQGPTLGSRRTDPSVVPGSSGAFVAYVQRRGTRRTGIYVRRIRSNGKLGKAKRVSRSDPTELQLLRGPIGNLAIVYPSATHSRALIVRSRKGRRW